MGRIQGDLLDRTFQFGLVVLDLVDYLPDGTKGWVIGKQLLRSGTSIGSNIHEAQNALTDREFAHLCNIARKEANETRYWLSLCRKGKLLDGQIINDAVKEASELHRILSTIVQKTHQHIDQNSSRKR